MLRIYTAQKADGTWVIGTIGEDIELSMEAATIKAAQLLVSEELTDKGIIGECEWLSPVYYPRNPPRIGKEVA